LCSANVCDMPNGKCIDVYTCQCEPGWKGEYCDEVDVWGTFNFRTAAEIAVVATIIAVMMIRYLNAVERKHYMNEMALAKWANEPLTESDAHLQALLLQYELENGSWHSSDWNSEELDNQMDQHYDVKTVMGPHGPEQRVVLTQKPKKQLTEADKEKVAAIQTPMQQRMAQEAQEKAKAVRKSLGAGGQRKSIAAMKKAIKNDNRQSVCLFFMTENERSKMHGDTWKKVREALPNNVKPQAFCIGATEDLPTPAHVNLPSDKFNLKFLAIDIGHMSFLGDSQQTNTSKKDAVSKSASQTSAALSNKLSSAKLGGQLTLADNTVTNRNKISAWIKSWQDAYPSLDDTIMVVNEHWPQSKKDALSSAATQQVFSNYVMMTEAPSETDTFIENKLMGMAQRLKAKKKEEWVDLEET